MQEGWGSGGCGACDGPAAAFITSPSPSPRFQVKAGLLALDFDTPDVARDLASVLFDALAPVTAEALGPPARALLAAMLAEAGGDPPDELVDEVVARLLPPAREDGPQAARWAGVCSRLSGGRARSKRRGGCGPRPSSCPPAPHTTPP